MSYNLTKQEYSDLVIVYLITKFGIYLQKKKPQYTIWLSYSCKKLLEEEEFIKQVIDRKVSELSEDEYDFISRMLHNNPTVEIIPFDSLRFITVELYKNKTQNFFDPHNIFCYISTDSIPYWAESWGRFPSHPNEPYHFLAKLTGAFGDSNIDMDEYNKDPDKLFESYDKSIHEMMAKMIRRFIGIGD